MVENEGIQQFAYFREFSHTNQFELLFKIETEIPELGIFKEEIKAVRAVADTVSSLLQHIQKKILKIITDKYVKNENDDEVLKENIEVPVSLKTDKRHLKGSMALMTLLNNLLKNQFVIFEVFDQQYIVLPNAPLIKQIKLPPVLYTNTHVQPFKFSAIFIENQKSTFIWYKSNDKVTWVEAAKGFGYMTKSTDAGFYLKLVCKPVSKIGIHGPSEEAESDTAVENMGELPVCPFERRHEYTKAKLSNNNE